ncbi:MAG: FAD-binding oxidoreductase [Blastocatellia bacterium]|nr:FAD-binding oxidoreductase [Blastocatellia bacterium]
MSYKRLTNWGNYPAVEADLTEPASRDELLAGLSDGVIARGNGRSYGDASLGERVISMLKLDRIISIDEQVSIIECEAGTLLSTILEQIVPKGLFLPVSPGTKFITVGGAIAADVHGKNHHSEGSFTDHLESFMLMTADGEILKCSREENSELFRSTCGGMGLTGVIISARFRLKRIETSFIAQRSFKARDLAHAISLFDEHGSATYSVAWIDCLAKGKARGRSLLLTGEHCPLSDLPPRLASQKLRTSRQPRLAVPFTLPAMTLNRFSVRAFNLLYYNRQLAAERSGVVHYDPFFYPLDGIRNWNRIYGRPGFVQYQFVVPKAVSQAAIDEVLGRVAASGEGSFLAVLKLFGKANVDAIMSFPMEGYTLALDFRVSDEVFKLLDELDAVVADAGGRIYLAKDARMKPEIFHRTYARTVASGSFRSAQSDRLRY